MTKDDSLHERGPSPRREIMSPFYGGASSVASVRCPRPSYITKDSTKAQLLEAKSNLQRMLQAIPLTEEERAAVEDGAAAVEQLVQRLADVPTPAGPTPRELSREAVIPLRPVSAPASQQETIP